MNKRVMIRIGRTAFHLYVLLFSTILTLPISGCGPDAEEVSAALYADDGFLRTLQRTVFPETYWQGKVTDLEQEIQSDLVVFQERNHAYHNLLLQRRDTVLQSVAKAKAEGADPRVARRDVIQKYRPTLNPLREQTRQKGKRLRRKMELLLQARDALRQAQ